MFICAHNIKNQHFSNLYSKTVSNLLKRSLSGECLSALHKGFCAAETGDCSSRSKSHLPGCVSHGRASLRELCKVAEAGDLNEDIQNSREITKIKLHCVWLCEIQKLNLAAVFTIKKTIKIHRRNLPIFCKNKTILFM